MSVVDWDSLKGAIKAKQYELNYTSAISWKAASYNLKHAADHLFDLYHDATLRVMDRFIDDLKVKSMVGDDSSCSRPLEGQELLDHKDSNLISVYFLLSGYAIENLLKGILMFQHPEYFKFNSKIDQIKSHNLVDLYHRCKIAISGEEKMLLEKLAEFIDWMGKYPVPLELNKSYPKQKKDGTWGQRAETFKGRITQEEINKLYNRLVVEIDMQQVTSDSLTPN